MYGSRARDDFSTIRHERLLPRRYAIRPGGRILTVQDLPPCEAVRWVASRKADLVAAVQVGLLSFEEACRKYRLSSEEFLTWQDAIVQRGERSMTRRSKSSAR